MQAYQKDGLVPVKRSSNPIVIRWARERAGFTVQSLAEHMKRDPSEIEQWESGDDDPSYAILEQLAYTFLKVPLAVFFFPEPPKMDDPVSKFRRLPSYEIARFSPDTHRKIRLGQSYQDSLSLLLPDVPGQRRVFRDLPPGVREATTLAEKVRDYLGITVEEQRKFRSCETAFKVWRQVIEDAGVFTFKDSFDDRFVSGFSLLDDAYPIIFVNNSNAFARQVFTLVHELGHILYHVSGVTDSDETYIDMLDDDGRALEYQCNRFAAHFLLPDHTLAEDIRNFEATGPDAITQIAREYSVSREVVLRRFLDQGVVGREYYEQKATEWNEEYLNRGKSTGGGNFYLTRLTYLGEGFAKMAFERHYQGRVSVSELASHLNMKARNIAKLESYLRW